MAKQEPQARKYVFKNTHSGPIYLKELRKTLHPGQEHPFEGALNPRTYTLGDKLEIRDLGPVDKPSGKVIVSGPVVERVKPPKASVTEVAFSADLDSPPAPVAVAEPAPVLEPEKPAPIAEEPISRLDALFASEEKPKGKKSKKSE